MEKSMQKVPTKENGLSSGISIKGSYLETKCKMIHCTRLPQAEILSRLLQIA